MGGGTTKGGMMIPPLQPPGCCVDATDKGGPCRLCQGSIDTLLKEAGRGTNAIALLWVVVLLHSLAAAAVVATARSERHQAPWLTPLRRCRLMVLLCACACAVGGCVYVCQMDVG